MTFHHVSASAEIPAPAKQVYALLADYHGGHPAILPKPHFVSLDVEQGGIGAGTRIRVRMRVMGLVGTFRADVTEPEPGRVIMETDVSNGRQTSFTVDPLADGDHCRVTITTRSRVLPGFLGRLQGRMIEAMLGPIFVKELACLRGVASGSIGQAHGSNRDRPVT